MTDMELFSGLLRMKNYEMICAVLNERKSNDKLNIIFKRIIQIYNLEKKSCSSTVMDNFDSAEDAVDFYTKFKFYIRRMDFCSEEDNNEFIEFITMFDISCVALVYMIHYFSVCAENTINKLAALLYGAGKADYAVLLLQYSYNVNSDNQDTIYNLSYILYRSGCFSLAYRYISKAVNMDDDIKSLKKDIEGAISNE